MSQAVEQSLALLGERVGDPAPLVYRRLFEVLPEAEAHFAHDDTGAIRGEMLAIALQCLMDPQGAYTANLVRAERSNHEGWGVARGDFPRFFTVVRDVCRETLGTDWTQAMEQDWAGVLAECEAASA